MSPAANPTAGTTPRAEALGAMVAAARALRGGRYTVKRGFLPLASWPWEANPYAVGIAETSLGLFRTPNRPGSPVEIVVVLATGIGDIEGDPGRDDEWLDEFLDDARAIVESVERHRMPNGQPAVVGSFRHTAQATVFYDLTYAVQGVRVLLTLEV